MRPALFALPWARGDLGRLDASAQNRARRLYIIDGIAFREYAYDLDGNGAGRVTTVTDDDRAHSQRAIRGAGEGIAESYGDHPDVRRPR